MRLAAPVLAAAALAAAFGCRPAPGRGEIFAAWEEGRTLIFEDPTLPDAPNVSRRFQQRLQKQVVRSSEAPSGRLVETVFSTFQGQQAFTLQLKDGGVSLLDGQGRVLRVLPEGFPDSATAWTIPGYRMQVLGRAHWGRQSPAFPATRPPEGVWVEGESLLGGPRIRLFYLPDFGEVEKREWRDGKWITTSLMVGWSFQEIPRPAGPR